MSRDFVIVTLHVLLSDPDTTVRCTLGGANKQRKLVPTPDFDNHRAIRPILKFHARFHIAISIGATAGRM